MEFLFAKFKVHFSPGIRPMKIPGNVRMIDSETGKALLHSKDVQLEFKLLMSQVEAMKYAAYLTRALREVEPNPARYAR